MQVETEIELKICAQKAKGSNAQKGTVTHTSHIPVLVPLRTCCTCRLSSTLVNPSYRDLLWSTLLSPFAWNG